MPAPALNGIDARRIGLRALWFVIVPALLAGLAVSLLVPRMTGSGPFAFVVLLGQRFPFLVALALFFLLAALGRYWRFYLPGGRRLSDLPRTMGVGQDRERLRAYAEAAGLHALLSGASIRGRLQSSLSAADNAAVARGLQDLWAGLETSDDERVERGCQALKRLAAPALARRETAESVGLAVAIALAAGAALALRAWIVDSYAVLGASMLPTLAPGDQIAGSKLPHRTPQRGDIVVFPRTEPTSREGAGTEQLIKRVIGLPGDRITMIGGVPVINGWRVPTCDAGEYVYVVPDGEGNVLRGRLLVEFLDDRSYLTLETGAMREFSTTYEVKPGELFVLGDNRGNSADSRSWNDGAGGGVPLGTIVAQARWFLSGVQLDGHADVRRLLRPLDIAFHAEGIDARPLEQGLARCLKERPKGTRPPAAPAGS